MDRMLLIVAAFTGLANFIRAVISCVQEKRQIGKNWWRV